MNNILVVIPARGGSKGIPRKNLRLLAGKPLLFYSIQTALKSKYNLDIYVSSEDDEILNTALQFGANIHKRKPSIADDKSTLDPVVYDCYKHVSNHTNKNYRLIVTIQPTSPLLRARSLDQAISKALENDDIETIISAKDSTHLSWRREGDKFVPNYSERLNRQYLTPNYTETGGFLITRKDVITSETRIGDNVDLFLLSSGEEIDIDTYQDWHLCEYHINKKHIVFVVTGNDKVGLGHVYNTLLLANDILNHRISFVVDKKSRMAFDKIASKNYPVTIQKEDNIVKDIEKLSPDVVVNDCLDTSYEYVQALKDRGYLVVNFEDLGPGSTLADLVINAIYREKNILENHYFGADYFVLRDEFIFSPEKVVGPEVKEVLITFGGVDPNNYTKKVLDSIYEFASQNDIILTIITGFGYDKLESLEDFENINVVKNVSNISSYMHKADIIFTSAGRTVFEVASIGTPAIVLAQNDRELTHFFAHSEYGFLNLGLGHEVDNREILAQFTKLVNSYDSRKRMNGLMKKQDLRNSRQSVIQLLQNLLI